MKKILFVCLGNICRSPMAEFVFKDLVKKNGMEDEFIIDSAATSYEEIGNGIHIGTRKQLDKEHIEYDNHRARRVTVEDYQNFDYILGMESRNVRDIIKIIGSDNENKVCRLLDFSNNPRDIADPWYTNNFEVKYNDILEACNALLKFLLK